MEHLAPGAACRAKLAAAPGRDIGHCPASRPTPIDAWVRRSRPRRPQFATAAIKKIRLCGDAHALSLRVLMANYRTNHWMDKTPSSKAGAIACRVPRVLSQKGPHWCALSLWRARARAVARLFFRPHARQRPAAARGATAWARQRGCAPRRRARTWRTYREMLCASTKRKSVCGAHRRCSASTLPDITRAILTLIFGSLDVQKEALSGRKKARAAEVACGTRSRSPAE